MICVAAALLCMDPVPDSPPVKAASERWYACAGDSSMELDRSARSIDALVLAALARCAPEEAAVRAALLRELPADIVDARLGVSRREIRDLIGEGHALRVRAARAARPR